MTAQEPSRAHLAPTRRSVVRAAAWSVPAISIAASAPAFAASPDAGGGAGPAVTFTSGMFWRPNADEIADPGEAGAWGIMPANSIVWITQITNLGTAPASVSLELGAPPLASSFLPARGFRVLNASVEGVDTAVTPAVSVFSYNGTRTPDGRVIVTLPAVPVTTPATVTVIIEKPESVTRGQSPAWDVTVTPPGSAHAAPVTITSYADFLTSLNL